MKHVAKRLDKENHLYRGKIIEMNPHVPSTYLGRYKVSRKHSFAFFADAKAHIDKLCEEAGVVSFMCDEEVAEVIAEYKM